VRTDQQRRQRAANGSRRQRDLQAAAKDPRAVSFDYHSFATQHFPEEQYELVHAAAFHVFARNHKREVPSPAAVRERLEELGWTRAQREAA
jgi:DNA-binding transcriptional MocR family regulator